MNLRNRAARYLRRKTGRSGIIDRPTYRKLKSTGRIVPKTAWRRSPLRRFDISYHQQNDLAAEAELKAAERAIELMNEDGEFLGHDLPDREDELYNYIERDDNLSHVFELYKENASDKITPNYGHHLDSADKSWKASKNIKKNQVLQSIANLENSINPARSDSENNAIRRKIIALKNQYRYLIR